MSYYFSATMNYFSEFEDKWSRHCLQRRIFQPTRTEHFDEIRKMHSSSQPKSVCWYRKHQLGRNAPSTGVNANPDPVVVFDMI